MKKKCKNCKFYTESYGFRNGKWKGFYTSCEFKKDIAKDCKGNDFKLWESKEC